MYLTYSFTHKNAFFVGLDDYINPHKVNQTWLEDQLAKNKQQFVFIFGHEPAFEINHPDCLAYYRTDRDEFWNSLGRSGVQIYFCGHDHLYNRAHVFDTSGNRVYQMVVGSCGAPATNWTPPAYKDGSVLGTTIMKMPLATSL
jgi:3',5'-cyclic AMP phosphodiesterase CpdA